MNVKILIAFIVLLSVLLLLQWAKPRPTTDISPYEDRIDSLTVANELLLRRADTLEAQRNALRIKINALDSVISKRDATITNLNRRRNETNRRIDGLDNDGLIGFFSGFNTPSDTTGR